jgi:hypothetical protein
LHVKGHVSELLGRGKRPYRALTFEIVALLREREFGVRRTEDGSPEWKNG